MIKYLDVYAKYDAVVKTTNLTFKDKHGKYSPIA